MLVHYIITFCPTIYENKHRSRLTNGRAPTKGRNPVVTRNRRISLNQNWPLLCQSVANLFIKQTTRFDIELNGQLVQQDTLAQALKILN